MALTYCLQSVVAIIFLYSLGVFISTVSSYIHLMCFICWVYNINDYAHEPHTSELNGGHPLHVYQDDKYNLDVMRQK